MEKNKTFWWCRLFGHKIKSNNYLKYFQAEGGSIDGIGRHHINLYADCDVCEKKVQFGRIHGTEKGNIL